MKKQLLIINYLLLISTVLYAQKKPAKFFAEFGVGPSFPIGDFAKKTYNGTDNNMSGFANIGLGANLSIGYHINESVGLLLSGGYSINTQNEKAYADNFKSNNSDLDAVSVDAKSWKILKVMAGGFFVTPLTSDEDLVLRTKLTAGVCKTAVPEFNYGYMGESQGSPWRGAAHQEKTSLPWSFCYQVSIGLKYSLNKKLFALFDISSFNATAEKQYIFMSPGAPVLGSGPVVYTSPSTKKFRMGSVNAQAGVGIRL